LQYLDFVPKRGDDTFECQQQTISKSSHTEHLYAISSNSTLVQKFPAFATLTTLSLDNTNLLEQFKNAFKKILEWQEALIQDSSNFTAKGGLFFHKGKFLFLNCCHTELFDLFWSKKPI
jgi:hypothetical protein